jgi:hypothetical protein
LNASKSVVSLRTFIKTSGFLLLLFGLFSVLLRILQFFFLGDPPLETLALDQRFFYLQGIPSLLAAIFFLAGATALYLYQAHRLGRLGLLIYFITFSTLVLSAGSMWTYAFTAPALAQDAPGLLTSPDSGVVRAVLVSMAVGQVGWLLLLLVSLRARIIPRWALIIAILSICMVVVLTPFAQNQALRFIYNLLLGLGPLAIGFVLWRIEPQA